MQAACASQQGAAVASPCSAAQLAPRTAQTHSFEPSSNLATRGGRRAARLAARAAAGGGSSAAPPVDPFAEKTVYKASFRAALSSTDAPGHMSPAGSTWIVNRAAAAAKPTHTLLSLSCRRTTFLTKP